MNRSRIQFFILISLLSVFFYYSELNGQPANKNRSFAFPGRFMISLDGTITGIKSEYPSHPGGGVQGSVSYYFPGTGTHALAVRFYGGSRTLFGSDLKMKPDGFTTTLYNIGLGTEYLYQTGIPVNPYISAGISYFGFDPKITGGRSPNNSKNLYSRNSFSADIEAGVKIAMSDNFYLKLAGSVHPSSTDFLDDIKANGNNDMFYTGIFGISVLFGRDGDKDKDGIKDKYDACPGQAEDMDGFEDTDGCPDIDNDHDGIADKKDGCPDSPEDMDGYEDADGCPDFDNDKDGIHDEKDNCPDIPEDFDGYEDTDGCPDYDNDKDGIMDKDDKCPNSAETFNGYEDMDGCPDTKPLPQTGKKNGARNLKDSLKQHKKGINAGIEGKEQVNIPRQIMIHGELTFEEGSAGIKPQAHAELNRIADLLRSAPETHWRIEGYMDNQGNEKYLNEISYKRAAAVLNYLVSRGLSAARFKAAGMGSRNPVETNEKAYGRMMNRRVVLIRIK